MVSPSVAVGNGIYAALSTPPRIIIIRGRRDNIPRYLAVCISCGRVILAYNCGLNFHWTACPSHPNHNNVRTIVQPLTYYYCKLDAG